MASSNIKLFDENKGNMLSDSEFSISNQRMNGLQTGVASSQLQNKAMYQASLVAYAIAQVMMQNGKNANDTDAVSAFVANLSGTMLQKVHDIATTAEAQAGVATGKWMSPALVKSAIDVLAAKAQNILSDETKTLFGLGADAVPDDAFKPLSKAACLKKTETRALKTIREIGEYNFFYTVVEGKKKQFLIAKLDYESEINGAGRALIIDFSCTSNISSWGTSSTRKYNGSNVDNWLSTNYTANLPTFMQEWVGETSIYVNESGTIKTIQRSAFLLSKEEITSYASPDEGTYLGDSALARIKMGRPLGNFATRSIAGMSDYVSIDSSYSAQSTLMTSINNDLMVAFTLPDEMTVLVSEDNIIYDEQAYVYSFTDLTGVDVNIGVQIATGSYVGTGTYGSANPCSLTFDFEPKLVIIRSMQKPGWITDYTQLLLLRNSITGGYYTSSSTQGISVSWAGNTVSWYNENGAPNQFNASNSISNGGGYVYCAIG